MSDLFEHYDPDADGPATLAADPPPPPPPTRPAAHRPAAVVLLAVAAVAAAGLAVVTDVRRQEAEAAREREAAAHRLAAARVAGAERAAAAADEQRRLAVRVLETQARTAQRALRSRPGLDPLRAELLAAVREELDAAARAAERDGRADAHRAVGELYRLLDRPAEAAREFERAAALLAAGDDSPPAREARAAAHDDLGEAYLLLGDTAQARDHFARGLDLRADAAARASSHARLARVALLRGRPDEARTHYREAKAAAGLPDPLGEVAARLGDEAALRDGAEGPAAHLRRGDLHLFRTGDAGAARAEYQKARDGFAGPAAADRRGAAAAAYRLGLALRKAGDGMAANEAFREALQVREELTAAAPPEHVPARADLMLALAQCGQTKEAAAVADDLARRRPDDPWVQYVAACGYAICAATAPADERSGFAGKAVAALRRAAAAGWQDARELRANPELDAARGHPGFADVLARPGRAARPK